MNPPKCQAEDYINFLIATPRHVSATEAVRVQPAQEQAPAHAAFTRLLQRLEPDSETLWREAQTQASLDGGILGLADSTWDKPYAKQRELVTPHWSGNHPAVVRGINLLTLRWTQGDRQVPGDYRVFEKAKDELTKNAHFQQMLVVAHARGLPPSWVVFESWSAGLENLQVLRSFQWLWLTRRKATRYVNPHRHGLRPLRTVEMGEQGRGGWLEGDGLIRVFKIVATDGDRASWATNKTAMDHLERGKGAKFAWPLENYPRGVKPHCLLERAHVRSGRVWRNHLGWCLRAFLRIESPCYHPGLTWVEATMAIISAAVRSYLAHPRYLLITTA